MGNKHIFKAHTPLGDDLLFGAMSGREEMSCLFDIRLTLLSLNNSIPMDALLGESLTVEVELQDKSRRYFNGYAVEFGQTRRDGRHFCYEARLRPQLWFLTQTRDFKIFQNMTARDIVRTVLQDFGVVFQDKLKGYFRPREYTVCYGESYFDFISRLMEEEGIGYYMEHARDSHAMILCDSLSAYPVLPSHAVIPYYPENLALTPDEEHITQFNVYKTINPGMYATTEYDFKHPRANFDILQPMPRKHPHSRYEYFDYPGGYRTWHDGENYARIRIDSLQNEHERCTGETNVRGFMPGYCFTLRNCPRTDQNREYRIVCADYHWVGNSYESGAAAKEALHQTRFNVQPTSETYRPAQRTPYPVAHATEVAIVTGPSGQEIWTDTHGRVKVSFPWDRHGPKDQNSSCWVRVSQSWAGANFGTMHIPRIGQSVVIAYVNNNPDHPLIVGRVYNANNMPPWALPGNATQSGILTRSTKDGGYENANALRFEDKKGEEQLWVQAERNMDTTIKHDETRHVMHNRTKTVDHDETVFVHHDRTETVDNNETIMVGKDRMERVGGNETISVSGNRKLNVGGNDAVNVAGSRAVTVGDSLAVTVLNSMNTAVTMAQAESVGEVKSTNVGKAYSITAGAVFKITVGKASLEMLMDGTVKINGSQFNFEASGPVKIAGKTVDIN